MLRSLLNSTLRNMALHRSIPAFLKKYYWWLPFCLYSVDANAWGLVTHLYFSQSLLWAMPLLDPRLQNAIKRFPDLVMAGACLPDLAVVSHRFRHTHLWENAHQLLLSANTDEDIAIAVGYASHLYIDVIAHHHFVPAHEAMWLENSMFTHIASEWAMDAYLAPLLDTSPRILLKQNRMVIASFIAPQFHCTNKNVLRMLDRLAFWDGILRVVRLPKLIYKLMRFRDKKVFRNFAYYIAKTQGAMANIGSVLSGHRPVFEPEQKSMGNEELDAWRKQCLSHLSLQHPLPIQYFEILHFES